MFCRTVAFPVHCYIPCTLCLLLFTSMWYVKHLPFSITDHCLGLGFAGGNVFFVSPMFSKRPYELLSLLAFSGFFRLLGRKQNGMAARKLVTPLIKKPSHHAPTQRESCGVMVMLSRIEGNRYRLSKWRRWTFPTFIWNSYVLTLHLMSDFQW